MNLWWKCPNCGNRVDFSKHLGYVFEEDGEAQFMVEKDCGLWLHTIECDTCEAKWSMGISGMILENETK